jgi:pyruvate/2-oxoglutarate dehydrogenase complex dihydrolipoamide dehydrogenase (E3) component
MSKPEAYNVVVLGSGEAGKMLAWNLASKGKRTAVIERRYVGGSCPNIACLPSKNVIQSAKVASYFRRAAEFGIAAGRDGTKIPHPLATQGRGGLVRAANRVQYLR